MKLNKSLVLAMALAVSSTVWAEGISVEPGMWEMTTTMVMPMFPEPRVTKVSECIEESEISMDEIGGEDLDPNCTFSMDQVDGSTMQWEVDCPVEGGTSHGEWQATSEGNTVTGNGLITIAFQGQTMEMTMNWTGKRTGPCE